MALTRLTNLEQITNNGLRVVFNVLRELFLLANMHPYCIPIYVTLSATYLQLGYPDLAAGAAYKALLLCDAVQDERARCVMLTVHAGLDADR